MTKNWICFGFLLPFLIAPIAEGLAQSPGRLKRSKCIDDCGLPGPQPGPSYMPSYSTSRSVSPDSSSPASSSIQGVAAPSTGSTSTGRAGGSGYTGSTSTGRAGGSLPPPVPSRPPGSTGSKGEPGPGRFDGGRLQPTGGPPAPAIRDAGRSQVNFRVNVAPVSQVNRAVSQVNFRPGNVAPVSQVNRAVSQVNFRVVPPVSQGMKFMH
jgi:hypothetical protein